MPAMTIPGDRGHTVRAQSTNTLIDILSGRDEHTAFTCCHVLVGKETEAADIPEAAERPPIQLGSRSVCSIFHHSNISTGNGCGDCCHIGRVTTVVHYHYGFGGRSNGFLDGLWSDGEIIEGSDIRENGRCAHVQDSID